MTQIATDREPYLVVENLTVRFPTADGLITAVNDLSYGVELGKTLGIVGESGSGKSVSSMAILGLHDPKQSRIEGSIRVDGTEVIGLSDARMRTIRGNKVAMIFQDALAALHPFYRVGSSSPRPTSRTTRRPRSATRRSARSRCWTGSGSRSPTAGTPTSRTSSRAACASGP